MYYIGNQRKPEGTKRRPEGTSYKVKVYLKMDYINKKDAIYQQLKEEIISGRYAPESRLPKEVDFAKQLNIGRKTLRFALDKLFADNMIRRIPGKGTFVASSNEIKARRYLAIFPPYETNFESPMNHILPAIERSAAKISAHVQKYTLDIFRSLELNEGVDRIREGRYDGIFYMVTNVQGDEQDFKIIKATGLPVIMPHCRDTDYAATGFATMRADERKSFSTGLKLLVKNGYKNIATIFLQCEKTEFSRGFLPSEYIDFLKNLGVSTSPELIHYCPKFCYENIEKIVKTLISLPKPPRAIMCYSDFVALHVYRILREMEIKIPDQVAVMGYCNYPGGELLTPGLSTVDLLFKDVGHSAFELMLKSNEWWKSGLEPPEIFTPFKVLERGSTKKQY
jgi:DNA-binding LacI/PurR family transcriptional regulator